MIKQGNNEIIDIFGMQGSSLRDIVKVMYGTHLVWEKLIVVDLGTRKFDSYDIRSIYPRYSELTADNFFVVGMNNASGSTSVTVAGYTLYLGLEGKLVKSYNASTGRLTCYNQMKGNSSTGTGNVHVILVADTSKITRLGSAQSFNVTGYSGYKNFTADNFIIKSVTTYTETHARTIDGTWTASGTMSLYKDYNASKGLLTCYYAENGTSSSSDTDFKSKKLNVEVYLIR